MPISCSAPVRLLSQQEFAALSYELMGDVFAIRNELGRFFDERIYKQALAARRSDVRLEVPVDVSFRTFAKRYFLDVLVADGGLLEFKAVEAFTNRHRTQLLHYLFLLGIQHGLLVNVRPEQVGKEFVNTTMTRSERCQFEVVNHGWDVSLPGATTLAEILVAMLSDLGTCLELALYEEALTHFLGGETAVLRRIPVTLGGREVGQQLVRLAADGVAFKLTALESESEAPLFTAHATRLMEHTGLRALHWMNIARHRVTMRTLR